VEYLGRPRRCIIPMNTIQRRRETILSHRAREQRMKREKLADKQRKGSTVEGQKLVFTYA